MHSLYTLKVSVLVSVEPLRNESPGKPSGLQLAQTQAVVSVSWLRLAASTC